MVARAFENLNITLRGVIYDFYVSELDVGKKV